MAQPIVNNLWSGAVIPAATGKSFSSMSAQWVVPAVTQVPVSGAGPSAAAMWVGLDGITSTDVCQAGVTAFVQTGANGVPTVSYQAWAEWYPAGSVAIPASQFSVNPGDTIKITVDSLGAGSTQAVFVYNNETTHQALTVTADAPAGVSLAGNTAEAVVETPTEAAGNISQLANFSATPVTFENTTATYSDGTTTNAASAIPLEMVNNGVFESFGSIQPGTNAITVSENHYWT
jgi:hypothetical protein